MNAEHKEAAKAAVDRFHEIYGAKYPKAVGKLLKDREGLLTHFDFPAEQWVHLRSTNAIESTFATVRLRTTRPRVPAAEQPTGHGIQAPRRRPGSLALRQRTPPDRARATFVDGAKVEREDQRNVA
jgi:hypothetical protein